jgi:hypothetical protein
VNRALARAARPLRIAVGLAANLAAGLALALIGSPSARAEPYLAVQQGYQCSTCHVNPTGGGLRNDFGIIFAENLMPVRTVSGVDGLWTGKIGDYLRAGGDLRTNWTRSSTPHDASLEKFAVDQMRVYAEVRVIPDRLGLYVDELVAPNSPENMEAYVRLGSATHGWYFKGGKFYLPFGWRLQDQTAFVREVTGISMTTPDNGVELGYGRDAWSAQIDLTNGAANAQSGHGHQLTAQAVYVQPRWRLGAAGSLTQSDAGNRRVIGTFAGLRTGPIAWLAEADLVSDAGFPGGTRQLLSGLAEMDWNFARGQNLKLTAEYFDPDRAVAADQQTRWSAVYELTPLPFVQLRAGFRRYRGIPQNDLQNRQLAFLELHGFF